MNFSDIISSWGLILAYILIAVALLAAIVLPLLNSLSNPKSLLKTLGGVVLLVVLFFIAYAISGGEVLPTYVEQGVTTSGTSKFVGGVLITMYILIVFALLAIAITEIKKVFK